MNLQVPGWFPEILPWVCLKMGVHKFYTNCLHRKLQFDPENDDWPILGYPASSFKCSGWWSKMAFKLRNKRISTDKSRRSLNHLVLKKSIGLGYPLAIKHGNEKYIIYRWFSFKTKNMLKGISQLTKFDYRVPISIASTAPDLLTEDQGRRLRPFNTSFGRHFPPWKCISWCG